MTNPPGDILLRFCALFMLGLSRLHEPRIDQDGYRKKEEATLVPQERKP